MIFKKAIPRRTVLRGMGASLALPFLDGMLPAFAAGAAQSPLRFSVVYVPNGMIIDKWIPTNEGAGFTLSPIMEPLAAFRDRFVVLSGLSNKITDRRPGEPAGQHSRAGGGYLTGVHIGSEDSKGLHAGISLDQVVAAEFGKGTQLQSLELSLEPAAVSCSEELACTYKNTISWRSETTPMPMDDNPRTVFERLFGESTSTDPVARRARLRDRRSILDTALEDLSQLASSLGPSDRGRLTEYLDAVRDIERRIQLAEQASGEMPTFERPAGIPATYEEHARLMFDLQVLAYQTDMTRVSTMMMGQELSLRSYREIGISDPHHPLSHHGGDQEKRAKTLKINIFHAKNFAYFLEKLASTPDGDGSLLDHMAVLYGASMGDGNLHANYDLPVLLAGGCGGRLRGGRHVRYPNQPPISNLYVTLLDLLGTSVERFGNSTGTLAI